MNEERQATVVSALRPSNLKTSGLYESEVKVPAPPLWFFLKQRTIMVNLLALLAIWVGTVYNSYLITYLLNMLDQVYVNYICSSVSAFIAYSMGGYIFLMVGLKKSIGGAFLMSFIASLLILVYGLKHQDGWLFIVIWQFLQFGVSCTFQILYVSHSSVFPTLFSSTSFGFLNFVSRFATALAPQVSNVAEPTPMITCTLAALLGGICVFFLQTHQEDLKKSRLTNQASWIRTSHIVPRTSDKAVPGFVRLD